MNILYLVDMYFSPFLDETTKETIWKYSNGLLKLIPLLNQYLMIQQVMQRICHRQFKMNLYILSLIKSDIEFQKKYTGKNL